MSGRVRPIPGVRGASLVLLCALLLSCTGADGRRGEFYRKGEELCLRGEYLQARVELKKALQVDDRFARGHGLLGDVELKLGNLPGAYAAFARSVQIDPSDRHTRVQLGKLLLVLGETEKALDLLAPLLISHPGDQESLLLHGALLLATAEPRQAIATVASVTAHGTAGPDAYLLLALGHLMTGDNRASENALLDGINHHRSSLQLRRALADLYAGQGKEKQAADEIRAMLRLEPAGRYDLTLADLLWRSGRRDQARASLDRLLKRDGHDEAVAAAIASVYLEHGEGAEAERLLTERIAANRKAPRLRLELADLYLRRGYPQKAVAVLDDCLLLERDLSRPEVVAAYNALASLYLERGEIAKARRLTKTVLRNHPSDYYANLAKGRINLLVGEAPEAVAALKRAVRLRPDELRGHLLLAEGYTLNDELVLALGTLQEARRLAPRSDELILALAKFHERRHDLDTAARELSAALAARPGNPELLAALGDLCLAAGKVKEAEGYYRSALGNPAGIALGRKRLAELYLAQGKPEMAERELVQGLRSAPDAGYLLERLVLLYLEEGKVREAASRCRQQITRHPDEGAAYLLAARVAGAEGAFEKAESFLREGELRGAPPVQSSLLRAQLRALAGDRVAAKIILKDLLASEPDSLAAANDYACLLAEGAHGERELRQALKFAEQINSRRPDDALFNDTLGWIRYLMGQYRRAAPLLQQAAAKLPRNPVVQYHAGMSLYRSGRVEPARSYLKAAATSKAPFPGRREAIAALQEIR